MADVLKLELKFKDGVPIQKEAARYIARCKKRKSQIIALALCDFFREHKLDEMNDETLRRFVDNYEFIQSQQVSLKSLYVLPNNNVPVPELPVQETGNVSSKAQEELERAEINNLIDMFSNM